MKKAFFAIAGLLVAVAGLVVLNMRSDDGRGEPAPKKSHRRLESGKAASSGNPEEAVRNAMKGMRKKAKPRKAPPVDIFAHLSGKDRKLAEDMQDALDRSDLKATLDAAKRALTSTNGEVRYSAVESLSWFGADALPELTGLMADADESVANAAENAWELALGEIDDASRRFSIAAAAMATLSNKDHLTTISGLLEGAALEAINKSSNPEKSAEARIAVVQTLVDIMESGGKSGAEQAAEAYESITGFKWISVDEAEVYLADPDDYELP